MRNVLVTGAGGGLGAAIAARFAAAGDVVLVLDRDGDAAARVAAGLAGARGLAADVTDEPAIEALFAGLPAVPDVVVNNAGIVRFSNLLEHSVADFRRVLDVNLVGTFIVARAAGKRMAARGSGAIVNISSLNAVAASPDAGAYPASKAAVAKLTEQLALTLSPHGVRVNTVAPGFIDAGMSAPIYADPEVRRVRGGGVPVGRIGTAAEVAEAVFFLASDAASYINGVQLLVDGGVSFSLKNHLPREAPRQKI